MLNSTTCIGDAVLLCDCVAVWLCCHELCVCVVCIVCVVCVSCVCVCVSCVSCVSCVQTCACAEDLYVVSTCTHPDPSRSSR